VATQEHRLALHGYMLEGARALEDAERKLVTALGQAATLGDDERGESATALLTEQIETLRAALRELSAWLDGPDPNKT
jgi:hypothetical protein